MWNSILSMLGAEIIIYLLFCGAFVSQLAKLSIETFEKFMEKDLKEPLKHPTDAKVFREYRENEILWGRKSKFSFFYLCFMPFVAIFILIVIILEIKDPSESFTSIVIPLNIIAIIISRMIIRRPFDVRKSQWICFLISGKRPKNVGIMLEKVANYLYLSS